MVEVEVVGVKLKVTLLRSKLAVAIMTLKAAANVGMQQMCAMGNALGGMINVSLKVYVDPYSVFTGVCLCFKLLYQLYYNFIKSHTYMF